MSFCGGIRTYEPFGGRRAEPAQARDAGSARVAADEIVGLRAELRA
ncbi:MAG: hypothetical protein AVDCRST_MAG68-477 [uncultured Gemmatimonadetes bacterium]|uniref:Uncharacterized protein n=1 Tax=uncultured Gemmatimonadota bacterium TaxID=203437 RepID=A0A6J4KBF3_9BACT|nr:MAG: hypothetical protein AVDCRST_MAG68-477 [uncultured Gemmatimonadota bacterium]